jgi:DNA-binding transcriptional LysR family regulator
VRPTEAGRLLAGHADAVLDRLALASEQLAELAGLRRGRVRLGSFFTAFAQLTPTVAALAEARLPELAVEHELVDRRTAFRDLAAAGLRPPTLLVGHGDEPVETQVYVVAGDGIALAYRLNVIVNPAEIAIRPLSGPAAPVRQVQAALLRDQHAPAARALLEILRELAPPPDG